MPRITPIVKDPELKILTERLRQIPKEQRTVIYDGRISELENLSNEKRQLQNEIEKHPVRKNRDFSNS
jgi:hypothetical protein